MGYYHICSDGNHSFALFVSEKDFKAAMNAVAICVFITGIRILAFVLMDNHFHFAVSAEDENQCRRFIFELKRMIGIRLAKDPERSGVMRRLPIKIITVGSEDYLKALVCYIIKNPTKARKGMFYTYPWGTGYLYFNPGNQSKGTRVRDYGRRKIRNDIGTHSRLPDNWLISDGIILPENYVCKEEVEKLFRSTRSFMFFLSKNADEDIEKDYQEWNDIGLDDTEMRRERDMIAKKLFGTSRLRDLTGPDRISLAKQLRRQFFCTPKQLSRVVQVPLKEIEQKVL